MRRFDPDRSVAGRAVLVTGAASGMGRATAQLFAEEGACVAVTDVDAGGADETVRAIRTRGGDARAWALDVANASEIESVVDAVTAHFGHLDVLVNNAGAAIAAPIDHPDHETHWQRALDILLSAHARIVRRALPHLQASDAARIVNVASTEGLGATASLSPYTAAKHGVVGLTRSLACELGPRGITVNCVCPGPILTGMTEGIPEQRRERFARRRVPLGRYGTPREVAHTILSLALPAASFVNGAVIPVDGGLHTSFA